MIPDFAGPVGGANSDDDVRGGGASDNDDDDDDNEDGDGLRKAKNAHDASDTKSGSKDKELVFQAKLRQQGIVLDDDEDGDNEEEDNLRGRPGGARARSSSATMRDDNDNDNNEEEEDESGAAKAAAAERLQRQRQKLAETQLGGGDALRNSAQRADNDAGVRARAQQAAAEAKQRQDKIASVFDKKGTDITLYYFA